MVRAKSGMSISAAMRAAPMKKLTSSAPHAGVRRSAPRGSSGALARRRCTPNRIAATSEPRRNHSPWSEKTCTLGSAVAKARITPASATASSSAPVRSASRRAATQRRTSTRGARATVHHARKATADAIATTPTGVSQRPSPRNGMNACPHVRSRSSGGGRRNTRDPATRVSARRVRPTTSTRRGLVRDRVGPTDGGGEHESHGEVDARRWPASR